MKSPAGKKTKEKTGDRPSGDGERAAEEVRVTSREAGILFGAVCFFSGASVMVIEISGNRLLAPIFGNSLYTWTALIGVVLVAFSAGGYLGGWLVDRSPRPGVLAMVLFASALTTLLIPPLHRLAGNAAGGMGLVGGPVLLSLVLFMIPGCLLGSITPFTIRLLSMATGDTRIGSAAGVIGMLGSLGSFVGTFASGFFLIPSFGVRQIFLFTGILLLVLAAVVFARFKAWPGRGGVTMMLGFCVVTGSLFAATPPREYEGRIWNQLTFYHQIQVFDQALGPGRTGRSLQLDTTTEGGQIVETGELTLDYQHAWRLAMPLADKLKRAVFLGAGAFGMPEHVSRQWPEAEVDVVEIDPAVIRVGYDFFKLGDFPRVHAHAMDARRFLNTTEHQYDFIFADAYNGVRYIPAHLTTREFFATARDRLSPHGVFMMNIISGLKGERAELFSAIHATVASVFEHVEVYSTSPLNYHDPHNIILMAGRRPLDAFHRELPAGMPEEVRRLAASRVDPGVYAGGKGRILTDDRNPVEYIVARQLRLAQ